MVDGWRMQNTIVNFNFLPTNRGMDSVIQIDEYDKTFKSFKEKAPCSSGISKSYIVVAGDNIKQTMLHIFNASMAWGYFPKSWRSPKIVMVSNKSKPISVDFQPISLSWKFFESY